MRPDRQYDLGDFQTAVVKTGRWKQNAYILKHGPSGEAVLIDPGEDAVRIAASIEALDARPVMVLLTHAHFDHVGALDEMCTRFDLPYYLHSGDQTLLRRAPLYAMSFDRRVLTVPKNTVSLEEADLSWAGSAIDFVYTPGHTDGGVCYDFGGLCFTGDTLMKRLVGRTDLPGGSGDALTESVSQLLETLSPETIMFPGHGDPWTVAEARNWWADHAECPPEYAMEGMIK